MKLLIHGQFNKALEKGLQKLRKKKALKDLEWSYATPAVLIPPVLPASLPLLVGKLLPLVERKVNEFITLAATQGFTLRIVSGFRSFAEQDSLYAQGRTKPGAIVTNARGGESLHNFGCAIDVVDRHKGYDIDWSKLGALGESLGFEWGGRWASFIDRPHFQIMKGYVLKNFQEEKVDYTKFN